MSTRQQPPAPKTPDKTPQQVQDMAPADRDAYLQQKADEGVDPGNWLFGPLQQWIAQQQAKNQSQEMGDKNVAEATKGRDVDYVSGLNAPNADYKGSDHTQLQAYLQSNLNVEQVSDVSTAYHQVHQVFDKFATSMNTAVNSSKGTWEGPAAENAQSYFTSLGKWSDANSQNAKLASETIYDQGQAASTAKNSMPAPIPFSWTDEMKNWATSNPFSLPDNVDKSLQKQKDSQAAHDQAASVMSTYDKNLYEAASKQPAFAPPPSFSTGGGTGDPTGGGDKEGINNPSGVNMPGSGSVNTPGGSNGNNSTGSNFTGGNVPGPNVTPHISGPGSTTGAGILPAGTTTPSGFQPGAVPTGSAGNPNTSMGGMPMSPMPMGGGMGGGFGGDEAYNSKLGGGAGGGGRGGSGFGPGGSGSGSATGAGAASGAARPGGIGAAEAAAGRGMGGLGSGSGAAGRGGMGAGGMGRGQKGEGDEDTEHSRPTYLVEGDPDEVFGTDMRTAPPVIGE
ncbi:hypothetical protein [Amycolatopsis sp. NBC_01286]|uniref:hypothetical protein n=1 Tax=Amycolatopsis sp. NBC_01286 TaxID=2903560 RepID=UPI002E13843D|nr:hypothetical protein OG570_09960 [Amycolatopsis sp. NBC_01286]